MLKKVLFDKLKVTASDGAELDTIEIKSPEPSDKYIINFLGNKESYEIFYEPMVKDVVTGYNVVGFNYRGVLKSKDNGFFPESKQDLIKDGIAQVQRLLDKGISGKNIFLYGESLGGALAAEVAAYFHQQGIHITVFSSRTFSSIHQLITSWWLKLLNPFSAETILEKVIRSLLLPIIFPLTFVGYAIAQLMVAITNWDINPVNAVKKIHEHDPDAFEYVVAQTPKSVQQIKNIHPCDDQIIPYSSSLYAHDYLKKRRCEEKKLKRESTNHLRLVDIKKYSQRRKMYDLASPSEGTHCKNPSQLRNVSEQSINELCHAFFVSRMNQPMQDQMQYQKLNQTIK